MVWKSFQELDEAFGIEVGEGIWDDEWVPEPRSGGWSTKGRKRDFTEEHRENLSKSLIGNSRRSIPCVYRSKEYPSYKAAARATGVSINTVRKHAK